MFNLIKKKCESENVKISIFFTKVLMSDLIKILIFLEKFKKPEKNGFRKQNKTLFLFVFFFIFLSFFIIKDYFSLKDKMLFETNAEIAELERTFTRNKCEINKNLPAMSQYCHHLVDKIRMEKVIFLK
jgi:hypothetical protein